MMMTITPLSRLLKMTNSNRADQFALEVMPLNPNSTDLVGVTIGLGEQCFAQFGNYGETLSQWMRSNSAVTLLGCLDSDTVGFVTYAYRRDGRQVIGEIIALAVHPEYRQRGIARHLLGQALDYLAQGAADVGARHIELNVATVNQPARTLFESFGFSVLKAGVDYPLGGTSERMRLDIFGECTRTPD